MPTTITGSTGVSQVQDGVITVEDLNGGGSGSAPVFGCRAWVNFDGTKDTTGATSTANTNRLIRSSGNITSVLRNSVGDYTVTFTTAMPDANYSVGGMQIGASTINMGGNLVLHGVFNTGPTLKTTTQVRVQTFGNVANNGQVDMQDVSLHFFR